jgi:hypothetical protein
MDFLIVANDWQESGAGLEGDVDGDNFVGPVDVTIMAGFWLTPCGP